MYEDCPQILRDFLFYMKTIKGCSERTVDGYYIDLRGFFRYEKFVKENPKINCTKENADTENIENVDLEFIKKITLSDVYDYLNYTMSECENNSKTRSRKVSSMRSFFKYLTVTMHLLEENPIKNLEVPSIQKSLPKYLTLEESLDLINATVNSQSTRDYCIITLFLNCGMRLSELVGINLSDIKDNTLRLLGKGDKERIIYINKACIDAIENYKSDERSKIKAKPGFEDALFLSRNGTRISPRRVEQIVAEELKNADLDGQGYSPHKLRHTAATLLYQQANVDIRVLKELLGHVSLATTEIYTHVSNKQLENAAESSPLASAKFKKKKTDTEETAAEL